MVLWEIAVGTAYFLGLKKTYKLALRIQRRVISPSHPKFRQFVQGYFMEVPKLKHVQIFLLLGVVLALFADVGFCKPSSVPSEGVNCYSNSRVKTQSTCSEKYLSESYFEKHDSLVDSSFASYIAYEIPIGFCETLRDNLDTRLSVHKRHLIGEGSHRKLHSTVKINIQPDLIAEKFSHLWKFVIMERLPSGVFADPFELQHLVDRGVFADATVLGDTNLELPSVASNRSVVEVHVDISGDILSTYENGLKIEIDIPLHTRYPRVGERGFSIVEFGSPDLFILSNMEENSSDQGCIFARELEAKSQTVVWEVPSGIKEHAEIVSVVTFVSAVVSALFIVYTTFYYPVSLTFR